MRQEREPFRQQFSSSNRGVDTNPPRGWNPIDTLGVERRLQEIRLGLHQKDNEEGEKKESSLKTDGGKPNGFEPFVNPEPQEGYLFVNNYGGAYSQKMELNRKEVERALRIAHLKGQVFLTTLSPSRSRSEAQGNELAAKRFLFFGEKIKKAEEENPLARVVSVPEGWRIEINDHRLTEELTEKRKLSGKELQQAFIKRFNSQVRDALRECVWREKFSNTKDKDFPYKVIKSLGASLMQLSAQAWRGHIADPGYFLISVGGAAFGFGLMNLFDKVGPENSNRNIDHVWEMFMPQVEIDKVARAYAYLAGKGRKLVKEIKEER